MNNNTERDFMQSNQSLIEKLQHAPYEANENLTKLIEKYKDRNVVMLAKFQVGLSKYFDFYSLNWTTAENQETINSLVAEIVNLALQIIRPYLKQTTQPITRCGCHDNACVKDVLGPRYDGQDLNHQDNSGRWPTLPADQAKQFLKMPEARILGKNCHTYRIIGPEGNPFGSWWLLDCRIDSKSFWREKFAVLKTWNSDEQYVDFSVPEEHGIKVWMGEAASQQVSENCILQGGYIQTWIHPDTILKLRSHIGAAKQISWPLNTLN